MMWMPCAVCKIMRKKCTEECIFAPYFPQNNPQKFVYIHKVFGASNVAKILNEVSVSHREEVVNSLAYEAEARFRDPIYGCVGYINFLQEKLMKLESEIYHAKKELASYIGPQAFHPSYNPTFHQPPRNNLEGASSSTKYQRYSL